MADTAVAITAGTGTNIDTRTESTNSNHRQVIVIGDPSTNAGVAPVDVTLGLSVNNTAGSAIIGKVGIDQTTDGTTNKVAADLRVAGSAVATGAGASGATVVRTTLASDSPGIITTGTQASPSASYLSSVVAGDIAAAATDSGNPVKIGAKAVSAEPTALTAAQRANLITDLVGKLIVLPYANPENFVSGAITTAMTSTTTTSLVAAPAAGLRNYITTIICSNAHATVGTDIVIQDGSGGTALLTIPAAAVYGGAVITLPTPLRQPTTATAIFCANVTTGASTKVSAVGYKGV